MHSQFSETVTIDREGIHVGGNIEEAEPGASVTFTILLVDAERNAACGTGTDNGGDPPEGWTGTATVVGKATEESVVHPPQRGFGLASAVAAMATIPSPGLEVFNWSQLIELPEDVLTN